MTPSAHNSFQRNIKYKRRAAVSSRQQLGINTSCVLQLRTYIHMTPLVIKKMNNTNQSQLFQGPKCLKLILCRQCGYNAIYAWQTGKRFVVFEPTEHKLTRILHIHASMPNKICHNRYTIYIWQVIMQFEVFL